MKKAKRANINWYNTPTFTSKQASTTGATKSTTNLTNTTNQVAVTKRMHVKSPNHNKKQNLSRKIAENQEVTPRKTCNKQKVKSEGFGNKNQTSSAQKDCKK